MNIKQKAQVFSLIILGALFIVQPAAANFNAYWDWHLVDGQPKRTLHYCAAVAVKFKETGRNLDIEKAQSGIPDNWAVWITEAVNKWNEANTGWTFEPSELSFPPCQVLIVLADISESTFGGGLATPRDIDGDGKADMTRIAIDTNLEETKANLPAGEDQADGNYDGWSAEGGESTRDPVGTIMHELSHAIRLDHHADSKQSDTSDPDISDPRKPGDHATDLSEADIAQARDSSGQAGKSGKFQACTRKNKFDFNNVSVSFDANTFGNINPFEIFSLSGVMIPHPLAVPEGFSHIIDNTGFYFNTGAQAQKPLTFSIVYNEKDILGGNGKYIGDFDELIPPALDENTIEVLKFIDEPFGVDQEGMPHWEEAGTEVDAENNVVIFSTKEPGIYALSAKALPNELTIDEQIAKPDKKIEAEKEKSDKLWMIILPIVLILTAVIIYLIKKKEK